MLFEDKSGDNTVTNDEVIQRYYYYPFGAETENTPWTQQTKPNIRYQYNGKEKIDELGLGWNDYGARNYDALLGRWMGVDALAEKMPGYSPYVYCFNNPILFVDPDGRFPEPWLIKNIERFVRSRTQIQFSSEVYAQMNKSWNQSFDMSNNSMEQGATFTINISKNAAEFVNLGGTGSNSSSFQPDISIDKKKNILLGTFHTHPYGANDGAWNGAVIPFSGGDFASMDDFDEAVSLNQSGNNVYVLIMTSKTPKNLDPAKGFYRTKFDTENEKQLTAGLSQKESAEKAGEFATRQTAKEYKMLYFKGENGKALKKQKL